MLITQQMHCIYGLRIRPVDEHNAKQLQNLPAPLFVLKAVDQYPAHVSKQDVDKVLAKGRSETGSFDSVVFMKEGARVMLTTNIDIADRLINGQMGKTVRIAVDDNANKPTTVYVKFDDDKAGNIAIDKSADSYAKQNRVVPIVPVLAKIKVRKAKVQLQRYKEYDFLLS